MEVQLHPGRGAHGWNEHIVRANDEASVSLRKTVAALKRRIENVRNKIHGSNAEVVVPGIVRSFAETHERRHHAAVYTKQPLRSSTKMSVWQAATSCLEALDWVLKRSNVDPNDTEKSDYVTAEWGSYGKGYLAQRKKIASVIKAVRTVLASLERIARLGK